MRVTIHVRVDPIDVGSCGKVNVTEIISNHRLFSALKKVGFKRLWRIRRIYRNKPFKGKYTVDAAAELRALSIDLEEELLKMMSQELKENK